MRRLLGLLALALPSTVPATPALAQPSESPPSDDQPSRAPIRAWMGVSGALLTDFGSVGAAGDYRFIVERLGGPSAGVLLGRIAKDGDETGYGTGDVGYGALIGGRSFDVGDAAFANASIGVGYGQGSRNDCVFQRSSSCDYSDARGLVVPARLEVHVVSRTGASSFGASVTGMLTSPVGSLVGVGLHLNFGRNMRGDRHRGDRYRDDRRRDDDRDRDDDRWRDDRDRNDQ